MSAFPHWPILLVAAAVYGLPVLVMFALWWEFWP